MSLDTGKLKAFITHKYAKIQDLQNQPEPSENWSTISHQLDQIGVIIDEASKQQYIDGDVEAIVKLFARIDKYFCRITLGQDILDLRGYRVPKNS